MEYCYGKRITEYAENGDLESIRKLLDAHPKFNKGKIREAMKTALLAASRKGHLSIVKMLVDYGTNVLAMDELRVIF
ncbi:unnamed protein product [Enterobius vermicularis]|uniref:ANK_REP_REGION domain-containing protein n=1 Tax=Enterobius vermicularis TaxID=51028 RepID=A0A0N4VAS5_ENTVE|nr:unnamed protein product [Enterobius vermicularis]